jgi:hypothetical protein
MNLVTSPRRNARDVLRCCNPSRFPSDGSAGYAPRRPGLQVAGITSDLDGRGRMVEEFRGLTNKLIFATSNALSASFVLSPKNIRCFLSSSGAVLLKQFRSWALKTIFGATSEGERSQRACLSSEIPAEIGFDREGVWRVDRCSRIQ